MKRSLVAALLALCAWLAGAAHAALLTPDPTGLWYDPKESGWGLSLTQQGDTIFAVMFVYDADGTPAWYVASSVQYHDDASGAPGGPNLSGTLYRTTGPYFGLPFDPHAVTTASAGTLSMRYDDADGKTLSVTYQVNGTTVAKTLQRQAWRDTRTEMAGRYQGELVMQAPDMGCNSVVMDLPQNYRPLFDIAAGTTPGDIHITWGTGIDTVCSIDGTYAQYGQLGSISGTLSCGPIGYPSPGVLAQVYGITHNDWGMSAGVRLQYGSCSYAGHIGGVRLPPG